MLKKIEAARQWAWIYYGDKQPTREVMPASCKFVIASPLHTPDFTENQKKAELDALTENYAERIAKAKTLELKQKLEQELEQKVEVLEQKQLKAHYHFLALFARRVRQQTAEQLKNSLFEFDESETEKFTRVERVSDFEAYFRYLFHTDNLEKQQFAADAEVFFTSSREKLNYFSWKIMRNRSLSDTERKEDSLWRIAVWIKERRISNFQDLAMFIKMRSQCVEEHLELLSLVRKNASFFARLLREQEFRDGKCNNQN